MKTALIETLSTVTSGKIFVEVEKARLTRALAKIKEEAGKVEEAAEIMQEVAVETYGALSKHEKLFFIEEQVPVRHPSPFPLLSSISALRPKP